jgi:SAM-dependent methyltransferase
MSLPVKTAKKRLFSTFNDIFLAICLIVALLLVFYVTPLNTFNFFNIALFIVILIPTLIALIYGAPFVPTPMAAVQKMLQLGQIKEGEKIYDIGCGDGRMVYLATKNYKAQAVGLELSPLVYALARIRKLFWRSKAKIVFGDFRRHNFKDADVIMCYLLPETLAKLQNKLEKELKKGARVVSYAFKVGDWKESHMEERDREKNIAPIWVYKR